MRLRLTTDPALWPAPPLAATLAASLVVAAPASATSIGTQGCTPGFWKKPHLKLAGVTTGSKIGFNWTIPDSLAGYRGKTFLAALSFRGGPGIDGAAQILLRAAVAANLSAAHEGVGYPYRRFGEPGSIQATVNVALASGNRQKMIDAASWLDAANNLGCPRADPAVPGRSIKPCRSGRGRSFSSGSDSHASEHPSKDASSSTTPRTGRFAPTAARPDTPALTPTLNSSLHPRPVTGCPSHRSPAISPAARFPRSGNPGSRTLMDQPGGQQLVSLPVDGLHSVLTDLAPKTLNRHRDASRRPCRGRGPCGMSEQAAVDRQARALRQRGQEPRLPRDSRMGLPFTSTTRPVPVRTRSGGSGRAPGRLQGHALLRALPGPQPPALGRLV